MITTETLARFTRYKHGLRFSKFTTVFAITHRFRSAK